MLNALKDFYEAISIIDLIYLLISIFSLIQCYKKGFVLSILSMAKWLLAYIITLILFPIIKPYFKGTIDSEYVLDVGLGIAIFIVVIFFVLLVLCVFVANPFSITNIKKLTLTKTKINSVLKTK